MAETAHPTVDQPKSPAEPARRSHRQPEFTGEGHLAHLAASVNQSFQMQRLKAMAEIMNPPTPVAQTKQKEEEKHPAQRKPLEEEKHPIQTKSGLDQSKLEMPKPLQGIFEASPAPAQLEQSPATAAPNRTGLPDGLKSGIESLSGIALDNVKVHYNSPQPAQLNALAYTQGNDIHVAPGQEKHLPHEAWHVVQQAQGRVPPTMQMKDGIPVNDAPRLEQEADAVGRVAQLHSFQTTLRCATSGAFPGVQPGVSESDAVIQCQVLARLELYLHEKVWWILEVIIGGRTPSPFPGTMGAHSTAWIAHLDEVRRMLINTELQEGCTNLIWLAAEGLKSPLRDLIGFLDKEHKEKLDAAEKKLKEDISGLENELKNEKATALSIKQWIQRLIDSHLTYINYLPLATVKGGDPSGHGEGSVRGDLSTFEYVFTSVLAAGDKELAKELLEEISSLGSKGLQKLIKEGGEQKFTGTDYTPKALRDDLIEALWSLFAAETPVVFGKSNAKNDEHWLLIWRVAVSNFLGTIMRAYPHAYDFTGMQNTESQKQGLLFAVKEAKIPPDSDFVDKILLDLFSEQAFFRERHDEVTKSDLKQSGSGFLATILVDSSEAIGEVIMIGRTKSPFSATMGAHTTAWAAHLDAVRSFLTGKKVYPAILTLMTKAKEAQSDEGLDLSHKISEKHQIFLVGSFNWLSTFIAKAASLKDAGIDEQISFLEDFIGAYLAFVNFLPLSTIEIGSVPGGRTEGKHRTFLQNYELLGDKVFGDNPPIDKKAVLQSHLLGLFDPGGLKAFPPLLGDRESVDFEYHTEQPFKKEHPLHGKIFGKSKGLKKEAVAYHRFYKTMMEAYPRTLLASGLLESTEYAQPAQESSKKEIFETEKNELEEILHQNNCLINAIKKAAFGKDAMVTPEELLAIRLRIGQIGTMLIANPRTISIICEVLNISRGIIVIYQDRPSEDFGDTSTDPLLIEHTGFAHFEPYRDRSVIQITQPTFPLEMFQNLQPLLQFHLDDLISGEPASDNLFFQLPEFIPQGGFMGIHVVFEDTETTEENQSDFLFQGQLPSSGQKALSGSGNLALPDTRSLAKLPRKREREMMGPTKESKPKKSKIRSAQIVFVNPLQPQFNFTFEFKPDFSSQDFL